VAGTRQEDGQIKGNVLIARLRYVVGRGGQAALDKVLERLPDSDRQLLRGLLLPVAWYPLAVNVRLDEAIGAVLAPGDRNQIFRDMGRASTESNLKGVQRHLVKVGDPHYLLSREPDLLRLYHDVGRGTYEKVGDKEAVVRNLDLASVTLAGCLTTVGWHERAIELCGGKNVRVTETVCVARGGPYCEYRCVWE